MPSKPIRWSSSRRSSTPQVNAPWAPPPWSARLIMRSRLSEPAAEIVDVSRASARVVTVASMSFSSESVVLLLLRRPAAFDRQRGPGDRGGEIAAQEHEQRADLVRGGEPLG